jgi:predicted transcriptional regulator
MRPAINLFRASPCSVDQARRKYAEVAAAQDRSRSYLINEAITNYIELHAYQDALVRKGLEEMRKDRVVNHEEVVKRLKRTGRARQ